MKWWRSAAHCVLAYTSVCMCVCAHMCVHVSQNEWIKRIRRVSLFDLMILLVGETFSSVQGETGCVTTRLWSLCVCGDVSVHVYRTSHEMSLRCPQPLLAVLIHVMSPNLLAQHTQLHKEWMNEWMQETYGEVLLNRLKATLEDQCIVFK